MNKQRLWWLRNEGSFSIHCDTGRRAATEIWRASGGAWWEACGRAADWVSVAESWAASWNGLCTLWLFQQGSKTGQNCRKELLPQCMIILIHIGKQSGDITTCFKPLSIIHKKEHPCPTFCWTSHSWWKSRPCHLLTMTLLFFCTNRSLKNGIVYLTYKKKTLALAKMGTRQLKQQKQKKDFKRLCSISSKLIL